MKYINVTSEAKAKLGRIFDVTPKAIYNALYFRSDSETSKKIRYVAISQYGGRIISELDVTDWQPNCQTEFEHDKNGVKSVVSTFSNNVKVIMNCLENTAIITMNDQEIRRYWNVTTEGWGNILHTAEQMSI